MLAATYVNPVIPMDFSDPDVCLGGDGRAYLTASSFGALPGLPVLTSDDLVNWRYVSHALAKHPFETEDGDPRHGRSVWAPSIRYRADRGEYVIWWGDPDHGAYRVAAKSPEGPWGEPRLVVPAKGLIDVCPLYDDDGRVYLVNAWAASRAGYNSVLTVRELDADETKALSDPVLVYDGVPAGNSTCEGPKFYKKDGAYWLFFPAGGVEKGWQVAARAKSPFGPYEAKTVLAQGTTSVNGPHQGGWIRKGARDWFVHFRDRGVYGRVVYLEPMTWTKDAWPVIGRDGEPVESGTFEGNEQRPFGGLAVSDEFDAPTLGPQWQFLGRSSDCSAYVTSEGTFRLYSTRRRGANLWTTPNLLVQKFPSESFAATLKARISAKDDGEEAGLIVQGRSSARLGLRSRGDAFEVVFTKSERADEGRAEDAPVVLATLPAAVTPAGLRPVRSADVFLRLSVAAGAVCSFAWSTDGVSWQEAPTTFAATNGKWIGATFGLYAVCGPDAKDLGWIDANYVRVSGNPAPRGESRAPSRSSRLAAFLAQGDRALADRLYMYWDSHATDVFVRDERVVSVGGARAPVPTVMFNGMRSHVCPYRRPRIEDLPLRTEREGGILLEPAEGGAPRLAPYGKTGCIVGSVNREILSLAREAAKAYRTTGDVASARLAYETLDTYLLGLLHRNVATDLNRGHLQTLFGLQSMETIHDETLADCCALYAELKPYLAEKAPEKVPVYQAALRKWADVQIENGVADNNWDMIQLNSILEIALVLDEPDRAHYVDVVFNRSSVRNLSVKELAARGFDPETGAWWECPGYSMVTLNDYAKFARRAKESLGRDLLEEIPVLRKAFAAAGEYLFPDGLLIGFGDTHPSPVSREIASYGPLRTSPFFYAPNASWLVARSGMDPTNDVAFALNASLGNHQHANGISLELFARGYRLAPDAGIGWTSYSGDDYKEYYSQFPAHNTVMVNSRSTYQTMKSHQAFRLVDHGETWAKVAFREPATGAEQERTVRYVKDSDGAYFVDVFRSRIPGGRQPEWHDYYYHNFGDALTLNGPVRPTDKLSFAESGHASLSYLREKFERGGSGDLVADFAWKRPEGNVGMRVFMNEAPGRTFVKALAPATEGLSRVKSPDYGITRESATPVLIVRQEGEAWDRPFLAVMDPTATVRSVVFGEKELRVLRTSGKTDVLPCDVRPPAAPASPCACGLVPERENDFFWENDVFGMRAYGPNETHRWSGLDVFNKMPGAGSVGELLAHHAARGNWHVTPSDGILDNYTVGAGRGCGAVAMFADGEWKTYPNWESCEILTNGGTRCEFKLVYPAFSAAGRMTCRISLEKGAPFFRNVVTFEKPFRGAWAGPGLDVSSARGHAGDLFEDAEAGVVSLFEESKGEIEGSTMTAIVLDPAGAQKAKLMTDHLGCRILALEGATGFSYYAGAAWSRRGDCQTSADWHRRVMDFRTRVSDRQ